MTAMNPLVTGTLEHRGLFVVPPYDSLAGIPSSRESGKQLTSHGREVLAFDDVMNYRNKNWSKLWENKRHYKSLTSFMDKGPLHVGDNLDADVEMVNEYVGKIIQGVKPSRIKVPCKIKRQANRLREFVDAYHEPIKDEKSYWAVESVPVAFQGKYVGDTVVPTQVVRTNTNPGRLHDYMGIGMSYKYSSNGEGMGTYPDGCLIIISDASGFPSKFDWESTEYILPIGCRFEIEDVYKADLERSFEHFKDFTVIEVRMLAMNNTTR